MNNKSNALDPKGPELINSIMGLQKRLNASKKALRILLKLSYSSMEKGSNSERFTDQIKGALRSMKNIKTLYLNRLKVIEIQTST